MLQHLSITIISSKNEISLTISEITFLAVLQKIIITKQIMIHLFWKAYLMFRLHILAANILWICQLLRTLQTNTKFSKKFFSGIYFLLLRCRPKCTNATTIIVLCNHRYSEAWTISLFACVFSYLLWVEYFVLPIYNF